MILETIVTTRDNRGRINPAPMGVIRAAGDRLILRPFCATHTYQNLRTTGAAVINLSQDGALFAYTALGDPAVEGALPDRVPGLILAGASGYWEVLVEDIREKGDRAVVSCRVVAEGRGEEIQGFNRARAALVEGAILATRISFCGPSHVEEELGRLAVIVEKTGGPREKEALDFLLDYVRGWRGKAGDS